MSRNWSVYQRSFLKSESKSQPELSAYINAENINLVREQQTPYGNNALNEALNDRDNVLKPLDFSTQHTLYSWKHSGVVSLYMSGATKYSIQMQIGHINTDSFDTYLKSLGLFENLEIKNAYPELRITAPAKAKPPLKKK